MCHQHRPQLPFSLASGRRLHVCALPEGHGLLPVEGEMKSRTEEPWGTMDMQHTFLPFLLEEFTHCFGLVLLLMCLHMWKVCIVPLKDLPAFIAGHLHPLPSLLYVVTVCLEWPQNLNSWTIHFRRTQHERNLHQNHCETTVWFVSTVFLFLYMLPSTTSSAPLNNITG